MRSVERLPPGIPIHVAPQANRDQRRLLLQLAERHGGGIAGRRKQALKLLAKRVSTQPRMHAPREDLLGNRHERIAWLGSWAIVYTVDVDEDDHAVEVTIRRVFRGLGVRRHS